jgi:hypothetical protein
VIPSSEKTGAHLTVAESTGGLLARAVPEGAVEQSYVESLAMMAGVGAATAVSGLVALAAGWLCLRGLLRLFS